MNRKICTKLLLCLLLAVALAGPAFAQSAGEKMHEAWHTTENAASHAWQGTTAAIKDSDITAKVKMALHNDRLTKGHGIHVSTHDSVVTLTGYAPEAASHQAVYLARYTTGVVRVNNDIRSTKSMSSRY